MLILNRFLIIFISFQLTKSEEVINNSTESVASTKPIEVTENDLNFLNLDLTATTLKGPSEAEINPAKELETSPQTPIENDLKVKETTPSWELIYPEQNSSSIATGSPTSSAAPVIASPSTTPSPVSSTTTSATNLPKYFKVDDTTNCQKYFGLCLKQVLSNIVPKLKNGSRYLNLPSLDPIYFNSTAFQYNSGPFTGYITIRYALIYGLTSIKFNKIEYFQTENNKFKARFSMVVPKMSAIGAYKGDMHVNNVRARPKGEFNVTMEGLGVEMVTLGVVQRKDDHMFLRLTKNNATTTLRESKINATGIFPDQRLNDIVVNVANQYWRDLFSIVLPETRSNWLPILTDALNAALAMVPFDFLK